MEILGREPDDIKGFDADNLLDDEEKFRHVKEIIRQIRTSNPNEEISLDKMEFIEECVWITMSNPKWIIKIKFDEIKEKFIYSKMHFKKKQEE